MNLIQSHIHYGIYNLEKDSALKVAEEIVMLVETIASEVKEWEWHI